MIRAKHFALPCPAGQSGQAFKKNFALPSRAGRQGIMAALPCDGLCSQYK